MFERRRKSGKEVVCFPFLSTHFPLVLFSQKFSFFSFFFLFFDRKNLFFHLSRHRQRFEPKRKEKKNCLPKNSCGECKKDCSSEKRNWNSFESTFNRMEKSIKKKKVSIVFLLSWEKSTKDFHPVKNCGNFFYLKTLGLSLVDLVKISIIWNPVHANCT